MRIKNNLYHYSLLLFLSVLIGCQQNSDGPVPNDSAYFPLQTGDYWIYQVSQENYSLTGAGVPIKSAYQIQQKVGNSFTQSGQVFFLVEESIRPSAQAAWQVNSIRTVYKSLSEVVSQNNNVPTLQLMFPFSTTTSWNINTYNANPDTLLHYADSGRSFKIGSQTFERTISVVGRNDSTLIDQRKYSRVYAPNVGLIYRENTSLAYCQSSADCIGKGIITTGSRQKWELIASNYLK